LSRPTDHEFHDVLFVASLKNSVRFFVLWHLLLLTAGAAGATRVAIVGADPGAGFGKVLDLATTEFRDSKDIDALERAQMERILREHELAVSNGVADGERAVKAGQLLHVDLFAVLEGGGSDKGFGVVVFDAA